jgi:chemotaxis family two-component system response regulator Rcp1
MWILHVEDNPGDARLLREAFQERGIQAQIEGAEDGEIALKLLRERTPQLIVLDLNLPKMNGEEVLAELKSDPNLRRIPVIVLSSSRDQRDILASYDNHANCYITKPSSFEEFVDIARGIEDFWLRVVALPDRPQHFAQGYA